VSHRSRWDGRRVAMAGLGLVVVASLSACGSQTAEPPLGFRPLPSFLPSTNAPVDRVVTASAAHRQLAVQGVGVHVVVPSGQALATVSGPKVPPFVAPPPEQVTATFTITLSHVTGTVRVRPQDFAITDQLGRTFRPTLPVGHHAPASSLSAGDTARFELTSVLPTGEGRIYWAPAGGTPIVGWDFIVEDD
jgi:hypothetical protein